MACARLANNGSDHVIPWAVGYKQPIHPAVPHPTFLSPLTMPRTTSTDISSKDPSKLSKADLVRLYASTAAAKEDLAKKFGQYTRVSHREFH